MRRKLLVWLVAAAVVVGVPGARARAQAPQWDTVARATMVLDDIVAKNRKGLPPLILRHAYAVAIFPDIVKRSLLIGVRHGEGVVLLRRADDSWTYPIFVSLESGSVGLQAGVQSTDLVMVFKNRRSLDSFLRARGKFTVGISGAVAVGGAGVYGEAATDTALKSDIVAFSRSRGLFAGAALAGASLAIDWRANEAFYGRLVSPTDIARAENLVIPEPAVTLSALLARKAALAPPPGAAETIIIDNGVQAHEIRPDLEALPADEDLARDPEADPEPTPAPEPRRPRAKPRGAVPDLEALPPLEEGDGPAAPRASAGDDPAPRTRPASLLPEPRAENP